MPYESQDGRTNDEQQHTLGKSCPTSANMDHQYTNMAPSKFGVIPKKHVTAKQSTVVSIWESLMTCQATDLWQCQVDGSQTPGCCTEVKCEVKLRYCGWPLCLEWALEPGQWLTSGFHEWSLMCIPWYSQFQSTSGGHVLWRYHLKPPAKWCRSLVFEVEIHQSRLEEAMQRLLSYSPLVEARVAGPTEAMPLFTFEIMGSSGGETTMDFSNHEAICVERMGVSLSPWWSQPSQAMIRVTNQRPGGTIYGQSHVGSPKFWWSWGRWSSQSCLLPNHNDGGHGGEPTKLPGWWLGELFEPRGEGWWWCNMVQYQININTRSY